MGLLAAVACCLAEAPVARAAEPVSYAVNARLVVADGVVVGAMHADVRVGDGEREIRFWLHPDRLAVAPSTMELRTARWIYPGEVDLGGMQVADVRVEGSPAQTRLVRHPVGEDRGRDFAGADLLVQIEPGPARRLDVRMRFTIEVPSRFGRLGRVGDRMSLAAPWYPLVVGDSDAWRFDVPQRVRVTTTEPMRLVVGHTLDPRGPVQMRGAYVPVLASSELHGRERVVDGVRMRMVQPEELYVPPGPDARGVDALHDLVRIDVLDLAAEALSEVLTTLRQTGVEPTARSVTLASVPSRTELAGTTPGLVLYSDRLYEVFPIEQTLEFHHRALRAALFRHFLAPRLARLEPPADRSWSADLRAVLLTDVDDARRHGVARTPEELLGFAAFHPMVDQLLYAPQIRFPDAYFGAIEAPDPFRESPDRARFPWARGRRILESARDVLGDEEMKELASLLLREDVPAREALERVAPEHADRLEQWLVSPTLHVNYRLGRVDSEQLPDGRWRHRVVVIRDGDERVEPVEVRVEDEEGNTETVTWDGEGNRGVVEAITPDELDDVTIDPRRRLPQSPELAPGHPRGDDATTHPWKPPLLRGYAIRLLLAERRLEGFVDFAMRRRYDLDETLAGLIVESSSTTTVGARYIRGLGPKRTNNSRIGFASLGLDGTRLHSGFIEGRDGGWRGSLVLSGGFDTREYFPDPRHGTSLVGTTEVGVTRRDGGGYEVTGAATVRGSVTVPIGLRQALLLVAGGGWTFGDALPAERQQLGGRFLLRGFETGELVGHGRVFGVAEHRWTAVSDMDWNVLHLAWLREIQLSVFAGAGMVFEDLEGRDAIFAAEVGAGIHLMHEYGGVQPGVFSIDVGVPLTRRPNSLGSDGRTGASRSPVGIHVAFDQYF